MIGSSNASLSFNKVEMHPIIPTYLPVAGDAFL